MKKITVILILTFLCLFDTSYSQTKTQYEKKVDQIMTEMCKAIGVKNSLIQMAVRLNDWDIVRTSQDLAFKSKMLDRNELLVIMLATEQKLKEADKLKSDVDYKKKKEKNDNEKEIREQQLQKELIRFSDLEEIKNEIYSEFSKWIKKGEFETIGEYQIRIKNKEKIIDSIAYGYISKRVATFHRDYDSNNDSHFYLELKNYDPDRQVFPVILVRRIYYKGQYQDKTVSINDTLHVNVELAKKIKQKSKKDRFYTDTDADVIWFRDKDLIFSQKLDNWMIASSGFFFPKRFLLFREYAHTNNIVKTSLIKLTLKTNNLGLQEYFKENYNINIEQFIIRQDELKRNDLIKQAEKFLSENNFELAIKFFRDANKIQTTEDIKIKITEIEIKISERKYNDLIQLAEQYVLSGNMSNSIEKLEKANKLFFEANNLKCNDNIKIKIEEVENKIIDIKQNVLIKSSEQSENSGKISNSIEELQEANKLKLRTDLSSKIEVLKMNLDLALTNHKILDSLFITAQVEKLKLFNYILNKSTLNEIKNGYGQKYLDAKSLITNKINSLWTVVSNAYDQINTNRNREIWNDKSQELLKQTADFKNEVSKNMNFELNIHKALISKDKKYLKILKEDDLNIIVETIIKPN